MDKQQLKDIGQRLRLRRTELGLTREAFSELADIGAGFYGQLEVGTSQMSIDTLIKLSTSMRLPMEYILFGNSFEKGNPDPILDLLSRCDQRQLKLAKKLLQLYLMKIDSD